MIGSALPWRERLAVSAFGVRGIGSFYYLAFALGQAPFSEKQHLWALVCYVVLLSILVHGLAATSIDSGSAAAVLERWAAAGGSG